MRLHSTFQDHHSRRECEQARVPVYKCDSIALLMSRVAVGRYQVVEVPWTFTKFSSFWFLSL